MCRAPATAVTQILAAADDDAPALRCACWHSSYGTLTPAKKIDFASASINATRDARTLFFLPGETVASRFYWLVFTTREATQRTKEFSLMPCEFSGN